MNRAESCLFCGKPTKSHAVPVGYLCHGCLTGEPDAVLLDALDVRPRPDLAPDATVECCECADEHSLRAADDAHPEATAASIGGALPFERVSAIVIAGCPACGELTPYPTTDDTARAVAEALAINTEVR